MTLSLKTEPRVNVFMQSTPRQHGQL